MTISFVDLNKRQNKIEKKVKIKVFVFFLYYEFSDFFFLYFDKIKKNNVNVIIYTPNYIYNINLHIVFLPVYLKLRVSPFISEGVAFTSYCIDFFFFFKIPIECINIKCAYIYLFLYLTYIYYTSSNISF